MRLIQKHIVGFAVLALITAWAPSAFAATPEERAACEKMAEHMGTGSVHEHSGDKGQGPGAMTLTHERCKEILAEPVQGEKKGTGQDQK